MHRSIHNTLQELGASLWPYYEPDSILPHCTVSMGATDVSTVVEAVTDVGLPINAHAREVHVVEISTGRSHQRLL